MRTPLLSCPLLSSPLAARGAADESGSWWGWASHWASTVGYHSGGLGATYGCGELLMLRW